MTNCSEWLNDACHWSESRTLKEHKIHNATTYSQSTVSNKALGSFNYAKSGGVITNGMVSNRDGWEDCLYDDTGFAGWKRQNGRLHLADLGNRGFDTMGNEIFGFGKLAQTMDGNDQVDNPDNESQIETPPTSKIQLVLNVRFRQLLEHHEDDFGINPISSRSYIDLKNQLEVNGFARQHYGDNYNGFKEQEYIPKLTNKVDGKSSFWKNPFIAIGGLFKNMSNQEVSVTKPKLVPRPSLRREEEEAAEIQRLIDHYAGECTATAKFWKECD